MVENRVIFWSTLDCAPEFIGAIIYYSCLERSWYPWLRISQPVVSMTPTKKEKECMKERRKEERTEKTSRNNGLHDTII